MLPASAATQARIGGRDAIHLSRVSCLVAIDLTSMDCIATPYLCPGITATHTPADRVASSSMRLRPTRLIVSYVLDWMIIMFVCSSQQPTPAS